MRFMCMHKLTPDAEAQLPPNPAYLAKVGELIGELAGTGVFLGGEGLSSSHNRTRVSCRGGECRIESGPYPGKQELIAGYLLLRVKDKAEAISWASRYAKCVGDVDLEIGPVNEPWDLGFMPRPAGEVPLRVLVLRKSDAASEAGQPLSPRQKGEVTKLKAQMSEAGVLMAAEELQPSRAGKRILFDPKGPRQVLDGPFAESKELVAGFSLVVLPTIEAAVEMTKRFGAIFEAELECEVRPLVD